MINPYCTVADLIRELKMKPEDVKPGSTIEAELELAINDASRWIDQYKGRDYYGHDHRGPVGIAGVMAPGPGTSPLVIDRNSDAVFDNVLFSPVGEVRTIYALDEGGVALDVGSHFQYRTGPQRDVRLWRLGSRWTLGSYDSVLTLRGKFGFDQWVDSFALITGMDGLTLHLENEDPAKNNALLYWKILVDSPVAATLGVYADAALTELVAQTVEDFEAPASEVDLVEANGSGYSGSFAVTGTLAATVQGTAQLRNDVLDPALVPTDLPGHIRLAARLVAAALSGHNRKEVAGLDGQKQEILTNTIPKTVFEMLGRRAVVL